MEQSENADFDSTQLLLLKLQFKICAVVYWANTAQDSVTDTQKHCKYCGPYCCSAVQGRCAPKCEDFESLNCKQCTMGEVENLYHLIFQSSKYNATRNTRLSEFLIPNYREEFVNLFASIELDRV